MSGNLLPVSVAADRARVHPMTVRRWIKSGQLEAVRVGPRLFRIDEDTLEEFLAPVAARPAS